MMKEQHHTRAASSYSLAHRLAGTLMIDGALVPTLSGKYFDLMNPATMDSIGRIPCASKEDVDRAIVSCKNAQRGWQNEYTAFERGQALIECAFLIEKHQEELALLLALESGKALSTECQAELAQVPNILKFYGGVAVELKGESIPFNNKSITLTIREAIGVVGAIIPWNVPLMLMALKIAPAIAAGNSVLVKSAEQAPLAVLRMAELMNRVLPKGVFNLLSGYGPDTGSAIVEHPEIQKITFTGSCETGKLVYTLGAKKIIPVTLELGGKSPMLICKDMDLDIAVAGALTSMRFTRQGQSCTAASRILVHEDIFEPFIEKMVTAVNTLKMGDPLDPDTDIGTIVSQEQYHRVQEYVLLGKSVQGASWYECCELPKESYLQKGLFVHPIIFTGIPNEHKLNQEEIFGPVTCVIPWSNFDQAIAMANDSKYALAATVWTHDYSLAMRAVKKLDAGFVQVNQNLVVQPALSYGGFKQSGLGKEASLEAMLEHFTRKKTIMFNLEG